MSNFIFPCRRICCTRKPKARLIDRNLLTSSFNNEKLSKYNQQIPSDKNVEIVSISNDINFDRLTKEFIERINDYRLHLEFPPLQISNELTNRARIRAAELSLQNYIENTSRFNLIYNNEPIGEVIMSCQASLSNGSDLAKLIHDQLIIDLENNHSPKKRYTLILNRACKYIGFDLARNEENTKDFIVIYYYPVKNLDEFWHTYEK